MTETQETYLRVPFNLRMVTGYCLFGVALLLHIIQTPAFLLTNKSASIQFFIGIGTFVLCAKAYMMQKRMQEDDRDGRYLAWAFGALMQVISTITITQFLISSTIITTKSNIAMTLFTMLLFWVTCAWIMILVGDNFYIWNDGHDNGMGGFVRKWMQILILVILCYGFAIARYMTIEKTIVIMTIVQSPWLLFLFAVLVIEILDIYIFSRRDD